MDKYLIITDNSGQKHSIDLTRIGAFAFSTTVLSITYPPTVTAYAFKDWFIGEMERIMSGNWREVADEPTPPYAVSTLVKLVIT